MCSECSDWQNKNTAKCRPSQAKGAFRVRLFRAFITVHFFLRVRGKIHLLLGCRWDRVAYAYAKLFFRAGKRTLGLWVAACRDRTTAATLSQRSPSTPLRCLRSIPKHRTVRLMFFIVSLRNISMSTSAYLKHLQSLPNRFYASGGHTFGERHGYVIMWKEWAELSQVIRGFTGHVRKDGIRIFLLQRCKFLSFGGELYHEEC